MSAIDFVLGQAAELQVRHHLEECSKMFVPPLSTYVDIAEYSKKIVRHGITFEAWHDKELIGLLAVYFNLAERNGFITNLSVIRDYLMTGVAHRLFEDAVRYARTQDCMYLALEVNSENKRACHFYSKKGFKVVTVNKEKLLMRYEITNE